MTIPDLPQYDVLVTGAEVRQGLAVIRSLGRRGLRVFAAGASQKSLGFRSRYSAATAVYPSPAGVTRDFANAILELVNRYRIPMVMPSVESSVIALDEHRSLFEGRTILALTPHAALVQALDKRATYSAAAELGIRIPQSCYPSSVAEALAFGASVGYPVVMKPRALSSFQGVAGELDFKVRYARDSDELHQAMQGFSQNGAFPLLQEYMSGLGVAHSLLMVDGEPRGLYQHRRVRECPLTGGVASVIASEPVDPQLLEWTKGLLLRLGWEGIAQVEYRHDRKKDLRVLIEINGRIWAPLSGALQLGLDFPYAWYQHLTTGAETTLPSGYPLGRHFRYLRGDLVSLEEYLRGETPTYLQPLPGKLSAIWHVIRDFRPGIGGDVACWSDLKPGWHEFRFLTSRYMGRLVRLILRR